MNLGFWLCLKKKPRCGPIESKSLQANSAKGPSWEAPVRACAL